MLAIEASMRVSSRANSLLPVDVAANTSRLKFVALPLQSYAMIFTAKHPYAEHRVIYENAAPIFSYNQ